MSRPYRRRPPGPASRSISPIRPRASRSPAAPSPTRSPAAPAPTQSSGFARCRHGRWRRRHRHDCPDRDVGGPEQRQQCADRQRRGRIGGDGGSRRHDQSRQPDRGLHHHGQRVWRHDHRRQRQRHHQRVCRRRHGRWRRRHGHDCPDRNVGGSQQRRRTRRSSTSRRYRRRMPRPESRSIWPVRPKASPSPAARMPTPSPAG